MRRREEGDQVRWLAGLERCCVTALTASEKNGTTRILPKQYGAV